MTDSREVEARRWWRARRLRYNVVLLLAGAAAFAVYVGLVSSAPAGALGDGPEPPEISGFTTAVQGIAYLVAMGIANVCYGLGLVVERIVRPADALRFRERAYVAGLVFSAALPFAMPVLVAARIWPS